MATKDRSGKRKRLMRRLATCGLIVGALYLFSIFLLDIADKYNSFPVALGFLVLSVASVVTFLIVSPDMPWRSGDLRDWVRPKPIATIVGALLYAAGLVAGFLPFAEPSVATRADIDEVITTIKGEQRRSVIAQRISGLWGSQDCRHTFRFRLVDNLALTITAVRRPAGQEPWQSVATVTGITDRMIESRAETPAAQKGSAATFHLESGAIETLLWDDHTNEEPVRLVRCRA